MANGGGGGRRRKGVRRGKVKKKTKYLSLSRHLAQAAEVVVDRSESLSVEESAPPSPLEAPSMEEAERTPEEDVGGHEQQQLDPFALHPEAPSMLFAAAPSLNDILGTSSSSFSAGGGGGGESPSCAPSPDGTGRFEGEEEDLARRALRGRERWVYCSRSSSSSPSAATATATATTSSSCSSAASTGAASAARSPLLKLDYDEILAAWAGRGSLYIDAAPSLALAAPKLEELDSVSLVKIPFVFLGDTRS
jgi:hypothetical protein